MLILRIRQAEVATVAGRLDESFDLIQRDGRFRSHRRGQDAITRLVAALVRRGREHLSAGRTLQAAGDCEKAGRLGGGGLPDVAQLAADLAAEREGRQRRQREAALALAAARRHLEEGGLSVGQRVLAGVADDDSRARRLMNDIDDQRARLESALAATAAAFARGDWPAAAEAVVRGRSIAAGDARVAEHAGRIAAELADEARDEMRAGRLDHVANVVRLLRRVDPDSALAGDFDRALELCRRAWALLERARPHEAGEVLRRVETLVPQTAWVGDVLKHLDAATEAMGELRAGPLSLVADVAGAADPGLAPTIAPPANGARPMPRPGVHVRHAAFAGDARAFPLGGHAAPVGDGLVGHPGAPAPLPDRFILQVDGAGSFLVVCGAVVKVGPISSSVMPDVALIADAAGPVVSIERLEEDYFLRSTVPVALNDRPAKDALLSAGDRVALSPRCRFTFAVPHAASTTAVLDLSGARYPRADVRRVILLDRDLVLGAGPASHVRVPGLARPVVLNLRAGLLRASVEATVDGRAIGRAEGLPMGVPVSAGGATFVIGRV
jgi:hypothetical protein